MESSPYTPIVHDGRDHVNGKLYFCSDTARLHRISTAPPHGITALSHTASDRIASFDHRKNYYTPSTSSPQAPGIGTENVLRIPSPSVSKYTWFNRMNISSASIPDGTSRVLSASIGISSHRIMLEVYRIVTASATASAISTDRSSLTAYFKSTASVSSLQGPPHHFKNKIMTASTQEPSYDDPQWVTAEGPRGARSTVPYHLHYYSTASALKLQPHRITLFLK